MSRRYRTSTRAIRRLRVWTLRAAVWALIFVFLISAVGALFVVAH